MPKTTENKDLLLCYTPKTKQGIFLYGDDQLLLSCNRIKTRIGNRGDYSSEDKRPPSHQVPCSQWVQNFSDPQIEAGQVYRTETTDSRSGSNIEKSFSGLKFDIGAGVWRCHWKLKNFWHVYNSSYYSTMEISLELNLQEKIGQYTEKEYDDMSD